MADVQVLVAFPAADRAAANTLAGDLREHLARDRATSTVQRVRQDPLEQDFGATLAIVVGSAAGTALARGMATWLARHHDVEVHLRRTDPEGGARELTVRGRPSAGTERIVTEFLSE